MPAVPSPADPTLRWLYLEQYGAEVLCLADEARPRVYSTVFQAVEAARARGGCSLGRCLHAPMRWVLIRAAEEAGLTPR